MTIAGMASVIRLLVIALRAAMRLPALAAGMMQAVTLCIITTYRMPYSELLPDLVGKSLVMIIAVGCSLRMGLAALHWQRCAQKIGVTGRVQSR